MTRLRFDGSAATAIGVLALLLMSRAGATAGIPARCYMDRRPGGCYEQATALEKQKQRSHSLYLTFRAAVQNSPRGLPDRCVMPSRYIPGEHEPVEEGSISDEQMQSCIATARQLLEKKSEQDARVMNAGAKPRLWKAVEGTTGALAKIDLNSIRHGIRGNAMAVVAQFPSGATGPQTMSQILFDCHGQYADILDGFRINYPAPPRSVMGVIAGIACAGAKDTLVQSLEAQKWPTLPSTEVVIIGEKPEFADLVQALVMFLTENRPANVTPFPGPRAHAHVG